MFTSFSGVHDTDCRDSWIYNKTPPPIVLDNILFIMAIVLSGNNFQEIENLARILSLHVISWTTFHMYQRLYICAGIEIYI